MPSTGQSKGTQLAIGIILLWFSGLCFFVAFLGGKVPSLTIGTDNNGQPSGPRDMSDLVSRAAQNIQALEGGPTGASSGSGGGVSA